ncbi:sulfite reductase [Aliarcobacter trophiarum LMG 25534]|uniref:Sulfite reductase n=1 Tax=Aliarcobacter trophiarum LMG 25534 TaxID=1032241 RepID=A0AAD0QM83_9BACT|nr:sulfite reductase [Aliarcobacter trophiarum]AXK49748.1 sulfite reductase, iron-sulfur subunit [Aliarcobacter trophiarum LMG 25534]RXI28071.1 sulfite reductase [Aliarcobacter trophiarum]RXJ92475.1 sulfite reductase [Aliarcobacter trophiarum LMG 25534]
MSAIINIEKLKKDINSEDILSSLFYYAVFGEKISQNDLERFKWHGIYAQDEEQNFFSLKIPLNLGELNLAQLESILNILDIFSLQKFSFKDGQKLEIDSLKLSDIPEVFNILNSVGLKSFYESSHSIKKVLTCPVNGLDTTQIFDVEELAKKLNDSFVENKNFFNLPNSLQFAISGYREGCDAGFTPDISFNAFKNSREKIVFDLKILDNVVAQLTSSQIIKTARIIASVYRDFGNREKNSNFREFLDEFTLESFCDILSSNLDIKLENNKKLEILNSPKKPRMGINKSTNDGYSFIGLRSLKKELSKEELVNLIKEMKNSSATKLKITHKSNIIILDVPTKNSENLVKSLKKSGLTLE